jgi:glycosyltransferase involved in cell wall biosynthesis
VAITDCIPVLVEPDPHVAANILRTTFETDRLPEFWQPHLAKFNEIWVPSAHNLRAFRRSGIAPEKLRVVKSCCDTDIFHPDGPRLALPETLAGRFVFLSVFDWQWRKGWDVLLRAYCQEFLAGEPVGLLLKLTRAHGHTEAMIRSQADQVLAEFGLALVMRPDIVLWDTSLSTPEMAALYRSTSAFVLPSRGEGWGRPYMEAMACGLPTIGTRHLGSADFMSDDNSVLVDASLVAVHEAAAAEIPPYRGHRWYEPDLMGLRRAMRQVYEDEPRRSKLSAASAGHIASQFNVGKGGQAIEDALADTERQFERSELPAPLPHQVRVALEGEFFAHHSFANINEQLAWRLSQDQRLAVSLRRAYNQPTHDESIPGVWRLRPHFDRPLAGGPHVMIRHAFPPNWEPVGEAVWVHIQPWEFGYLPQDWLEPLKERVHEIWVPTRYVQHAYERSGIAGEKIQVIPWGIDPEVFSPDAEPLLLPTDRTFRFLFVGGTIGRKGIDTLLEAYLAEFTRHDDVCLVVKDLGVQTFYRFGNFREQILAARDNLQRPSIVYLDYHMTAGQLASLYTACQCLAAPYRAEGFGLPILEGMACGLAPIVPAGGASEDFTDPDTAFLLPSRQVETTHDWPLAGTPLELSVSVDDVRRMLRLAYEDRGRVKRVGEAASRFARTQFTWQKTVEKITNRLLELARPALLSTPATGLPPRHSLAASNDRPVVGTCIVAGNDQDELVRLLAHVRPFVDEAVVVLGSDCPRCAAIAEEYGAKIVTTLNRDDEAALRQAGLSAASAPWVFWLLAGDRLNDEEAERIRSAVVHQPDDVSEVVLELCRSQLVPQSGRMTDRLPVRRHRNNGAASSRPGSFHTGA